MYYVYLKLKPPIQTLQEITLYIKLKSLLSVEEKYNALTSNEFVQYDDT